MTDVASHALDLRYDYIGITGKEGELQPKVEGLGYKLRNKGRFKKTVATKQAIKAYKSAPTSTRAHLRASLIQHGDIEDCDWNIVKFEDGGVVELFDVKQNKFSPKKYYTDDQS